jgi:outer membrane protein insertion porin family
VQIIGNDHTKEMVILREMEMKPGALITERALRYDEARITSLGLFNRVQETAIPTSHDKARIVVKVNEQWYLFPYPILGIKYDDWSKIYFGAGLLHNNFLGRDEKLAITGVLGYEPFGSIFYRNPFLDDHGTYYLNASIGYYRIDNKSLRVSAVSNDSVVELHTTASLTLGRRFDNYNTGWLSSEYDIVDIPGDIPGSTISPAGTDRFTTLGAGYTYDTRDLAAYPQSGSYARLTITKFGLSVHGVNNIRYATDFRKFVPLGLGLIWTGRAYSDFVAGGPTPSYNRVFFGYDDRIRGYFNNVVEGEDILGFSSELHLPIVPDHFFTVPMLPPEFNVWKFGMGLALFGDAGTDWFRGQPHGLDTYERGYGAGVDFLLMFNAVVRFEYALNEVRKGQFIVEGGLSY